jgi:16S rRNA (guanine527-N7)-methyltransferase
LGTAVPAPPSHALDLGSGAGLPGLVLALRWPASTWVLLDSSRRRVAFLERAVQRLGLSSRVAPLWGRAETVGRTPEHRGRYDLVTARSFASPAVTAECGAPLLAVGGLLIVAEPPGDTQRWPADGVEALGLGVLPPWPGPPRAQLLRQRELCSAAYPRRAGLPAKRPLF